MRHPKFRYVIQSRDGKAKPRVLTIGEALAELDGPRGAQWDVHRSIARYDDAIAAHHNQHGHLRNFAGPSYADYVPFDVDRETVAAALADARKLALTLHDHYGIREDAVRYYFTGSKGFELKFPIAFCGDVEPSTHTPAVLKRMARAIAEYAGVRLDEAVYRRLGTMRVAGTQHPARPPAGQSYRWKTELTWTEFSTLTIDEIVAVSTRDEPRELEYRPHDRDEIDTLVELYSKSLVDADEYANRPKPEPVRRRGEPIDATSVESIVRPFYVEGGRHDLSLYLSGYLAKSGVDQEQAEAIVTEIAKEDDDNGDASIGRVRYTYAAVAEGREVRGYAGLIEVLDDEAMRELEKLVEPAKNGRRPGVSLDDFYAYMPMHNYIFAPSREVWPASSVNARIPPVRIVDDADPVSELTTEELAEGDKKPETIKASTWLDQNQAVEQMTWAPGRPMLIEDRLISEGGWIDRPGCRTFNLYRPPTIEPGDPVKAGRWLDHTYTVYPDDAEHVICWLAHRVQRPHEKINHALVLGGMQGIGKDTVVYPVERAVGPWNFLDVSPTQLTGRFNGFVKSVILRVSEARDLGDVNRYSFYEHLKVYTAAPPDVIRCDEKNLREYAVLNVCGVVITTNHKTDGIYLPADDRRHYVAWSDRRRSEFSDDYWNELYGWFEAGGNRHVAAYLGQLDISGFNPKAPPRKTEAFWAIVDAGRAPEGGELADLLDALGYKVGDEVVRPDVVTLEHLVDRAAGDFRDWLVDRANRRQVPHRMEEAGYVPVRNDSAADGLWKIGRRRQVVYARQELTLRDRLAAANQLAKEARAA